MKRLKLSDDDRSLLERQNESTLGKWWSLLNAWEWPQQIPNPEPERHTPRRQAIMDWIMQSLGNGKTMAAWNDFCRRRERKQD